MTEGTSTFCLALAQAINTCIGGLLADTGVLVMLLSSGMWMVVAVRLFFVVLAINTCIGGF